MTQKTSDHVMVDVAVPIRVVGSDIWLLGERKMEWKRDHEQNEMGILRILKSITSSSIWKVSTWQCLRNNGGVWSKMIVLWVTKS